MNQKILGQSLIKAKHKEWACENNWSKHEDSRSDSKKVWKDQYCHRFLQRTHGKLFKRKFSPLSDNLALSSLTLEHFSDSKTTFYKKDHLKRHSHGTSAWVIDSVHLRKKLDFKHFEFWPMKLFHILTGYQTETKFEPNIWNSIFNNKWASLSALQILSVSSYDMWGFGGTV